MKHKCHDCDAKDAETVVATLDETFYLCDDCFEKRIEDFERHFDDDD